jgi:hypothetical protein
VEARVGGDGGGMKMMSMSMRAKEEVKPVNMIGI